MDKVRGPGRAAAPSVDEIVGTYPDVNVSKGDLTLPLSKYAEMARAFCPPEVQHTPEADAAHLLGIVAGSGAELHPSHAAFLDSIPTQHAR